MKERLKIFVDAHCFDTEYQGSRTFVKEIYRAMSVKKDIVLYLAANDIGKLQENFPSGENIVFLKYRSRQSFFRLACEIPLLIRKHRIDVAHFQYITPLFKNCRQVVTIHDVIFNDYPGEFSKGYRLLKGFLYKRSTKTADVLTTVSTFSKTSIQKHLTNCNPVHVIANGVSKKFFAAHDKEEARAFLKKRYGIENIILYVSRIEPRKNHAALLQAYLDLKAYEKGHHLVFIGHETKPVVALNTMLRVVTPDAKQQIHFLTNIGDEDLLRFYRAAHVFVYPSKAEGFGIPPLEAGAVGVPVLCSSSSAMKEFSFFGDSLFEPMDYERLKKALAAILQKEHDTDNLKKISEQIRAGYSWEASAEKLYGLIK
ncbi:glycosyltransferase family 4 protein [Flavisolibacter ginsenosidimutans]|uniref:Glycosyltransferase family 4 protein n=1 Tax=Flavisolibacter ginsenosidimutans TaxID=661481 RepID=A0A5B8UJC3_9BACT|nr:glycosyltransferase family 1 protein [Flavisolibacter ginsenosidimutans]QEC56668.1 glycosyltransferase family 4 protein [Flavisolibacter ginsenosidimutans]